MDKKVNKRKRSTNYTEADNNLLIDLVEKYKSILECVKTDAVTNRKKTETWKTIENKFNSVSQEIYRNSDSLRQKWENMKRDAKKRYIDEKLYSIGAVEGPPKDLKIDGITLRIHAILGEKLIGNADDLDSDMLPTKDNTVIMDIDEEYQVDNLEEHLEHEWNITETLGDDIITPLPSSSSDNSSSNEETTVVQKTVKEKSQKWAKGNCTTKDLPTVSNLTQIERVSKAHQNSKDKLTDWVSSRSQLGDTQKDALEYQHWKLTKQQKTIKEGDIRIIFMKEQQEEKMLFMIQHHAKELEKQNIAIEREAVALEREKVELERQKIALQKEKIGLEKEKAQLKLAKQKF